MYKVIWHSGGEFKNVLWKEIKLDLNSSIENFPFLFLLENESKRRMKIALRIHFTANRDFAHSKEWDFLRAYFLGWLGCVYVILKCFKKVLILIEKSV